MTFCIAIRVRSGIIALADTRIVKGGEKLSKSKLSLHPSVDGNFFSMTSGLRSIRDKTLIYTEEVLASSAIPNTRLYQIANVFGEQLRRVRSEDMDSIIQGQLSFNLHAIIGGKLRDDPAPTLFLIYPEGNWIEVNDDSPYFMIGRTSIGKSFLDKHLSVDSSIGYASNLALLTFDMTAESATDVDYPIDLAIMELDQSEFRSQRYSSIDLAPITAGWHLSISQALHMLPSNWLEPLTNQNVND